MPTETLRAPARGFGSIRSESRSPDHEVIVIGAGITGLTTAWTLARQGIDVVVLDAAERAGGVIMTDHDGDWVIERGPTSMVATPDVLALISELGVEQDVVRVMPGAHHRYVARAGTLHPVPTSPLALLRTPLLSARGKLRLLREPFVRRGAERDESVASFVRRRLGDEPLQNLVAPLVSGIYAGDAATLSTQYAMPAMHALEQQHGSLLVGAIQSARAKRRAGMPRQSRPESISMRGGLGRLTSALADALPGRVTLATRAEHLSLRGSGPWAVDTRRNDGVRATLTASHVVLATSAPSMPRATLSRACQEALATIAAIPHAPVATIAVGVRRRQVAHPLNGFGFLVAEGERRSLLGALFTSTMFPGRCPDDMVLMTCFVGGTKAPRRTEMPKDYVLRSLMADLRELIGVSGDPCFVAHVVHAKAIPQYDLSHERTLAAAARVEMAYPGLTLAGSWRGGVSVGSCVRSARVAAERAGSHVLAAR
jgi:oxygen-dependent protoporphyrinogen oxidase